MLVKKSALSVICIMIIFTVFTVSSYTEETWKITSLDWQPYSGGDMPNQGNSIRKLRELLEKEGIKLVVEFYPWKRAQIMAKSKEYVGYFPAWPEEVGTGFIASPPVDWSGIGILKKSEVHLDFDSIDDLFRKYNIGVIGTYKYPDIIDRAMKKYPDHVDSAPHEISLLKKLSAKRHDAAITDPKVMLYLAEKEGISDIVTVMQIMEKKELVLAFRNDAENRHRINLLKKLLENM